MIPNARRFLKEVNLQEFKVRNEKLFRERLDAATETLAAQFPKGARENWGAARKVLNIFLRDILYNRYLCSHFGFDDVEQWLEVPLDGHVAKGLLEDSKKSKLPKLPPWPRIIRLTSEVSGCYQEAARRIAAQEQIAPVHLDLIYWRRKERGS